MLSTFQEKEQDLVGPDEGRLISFSTGTSLELAPVASRFNSSVVSTINRPLGPGVGVVVAGVGGSVGSTG